MAKLLISAVRCIEVCISARVIAGVLNARTSVFTDVFIPCPFVAGQSAANRMAAKGGGSIMFIGATASVKAPPPFIACVSAKATLRATAAGLAREYGPKGAHVSHVIVDG